MNIHSAIRAAVLEKLKSDITDSVTWFDGRPVFLEEEDLPAIAVYLSDAECTGSTLDEDAWQAVLHVEVFLKASNPDSALDSWIENKVYPAMNDIPDLDAIIESITPQAYDYQRDNEMTTWGSVDLTFSLTYSM